MVLASSTPAEQHFDLVIFGTGSANSILGPEFDSWKVAIIEEWVFGGTCLNRGCIPTKMLVHAADVAETVRHASHLGIDAHVESVRWRDIRDRVFNRIDPIAAGGEDYRTNRCPNVTVFKGRGTFVGPKQIEVNGVVVTGEQIVVAVGARPFIPMIEGLADVPFLRYLMISMAIQGSLNVAFILFGDALNHGQGKMALTAALAIAMLAVGTHLLRKHYGKKKAAAAPASAEA